MYADSRKIHIIEAVIKTEDEKILSKLEETYKEGKYFEKENSNGFCCYMA